MKRRSGIQIMGKLIGLDPSPDARYGSGDSARCHRDIFCAIFLTVLAGVGILQIMGIWQGASDDIVCLPLQ